MRDIRSYLDTAAQHLFREKHVQEALSMRQNSPMEVAAVRFFQALLIWSDILVCSAQKTVPPAAEDYRRLLNGQGGWNGIIDDQGPQFAMQTVTGCHNWVLGTIMDTVVLSIWKRDEELHGRLEIQELVKRTGQIESTVHHHHRQYTQSQDNIHKTTHTSPETNIFAHAILVELRALVAGPKAYDAEIQENIRNAITAWKCLPPSTSFQSLAWPYCVTASLATESQRDFFRKIVTEISPLDPLIGHFHDLRSVMEKCWAEADRGEKLGHEGRYDWKDFIQDGNMRSFFA